MFVVTMSFSCVLFINLVDSPYHMMNFFGAHLFFYFGFVFGSRDKAKDLSGQVKSAAMSPPSVEAVRFLELVVILGLLVWMGANLYAFKSVTALLSNNPSLTKAENVEAGMGIVRRINWGMGPFLLTATMLVLTFSKHRKLFLSLLLLQVLFTMLNGSKGALLGLIFTVAYMNNHPVLKGSDFVVKMRKMQPFMIGAGFLLAWLIFLKEMGTASQAFFGFATRLLYFGDSVIYYYQPKTYAFFQHYNALDYLWHDVNPIFGFFRLAEYQKPMGYVMQFLDQDMEGIITVVTGPNTPYYIKSTMFFGPFFGLFYSALIGWFVAVARRKLFSMPMANLMKTALVFTLVIQVFNLASESELFISMIFDMCFWSTLCVIGAMALRAAFQNGYQRTALKELS